MKTTMGISEEAYDVIFTLKTELERKHKKVVFLSDVLDELLGVEKKKR